MTLPTAPAAPADLLVNPLDKLGRCDKCTARAYMRAVNTTGTLLFCGHHGKKYQEALRAQGFLVEDYLSSIAMEG